MRLQEVYEEAEVAGIKIPIPARIQVWRGTRLRYRIFSPSLRSTYFLRFALVRQAFVAPCSSSTWPWVHV